MTIKYDGATFDSVEELVAYKKAMGELPKKPPTSKLTTEDEFEELIEEVSTPIPRPQTFETPRHSRIWSEEKIQYLINKVNKEKGSEGHLPPNFIQDTAEDMCKTYKAVEHRLRLLKNDGDINYTGVYRKTQKLQKKFTTWTQEEYAMISKLLDKLGDKRAPRNKLKNLAKRMRRPINTVSNKLSVMRLERTKNPLTVTVRQHKYAVWTNAEHQRLKQVIDQHQDRLPYGVLDKLSKELKRTKGTISVQMAWIRNGKIKVKGTVAVEEKIHGNAKWKSAELQIIKEFFTHPRNLTKTGNVRKGLYENVLCKQMNKTKKQIADKVFDMRKKKQLAIHQPVMHNTHATVPVDPTVARIKLAHKGASQLKDEDLDFPNIFPISQASMPILEKLVIDLVANKGKLNYFTIKSTLQLKEGYEWSGLIYRDFCLQFVMNIPKIAKALLCDQKKLKVIIENGYHVIVYR